MRLRTRAKGQAIIEYILMVIMLAVTMAVVIRNSNRTVYQLWTGLARQVARGCADCTTPAGPDF
jgi:Flp pilus assembly pilin Flp